MTISRFRAGLAIGLLLLAALAGLYLSDYLTLLLLKLDVPLKPGTYWQYVRVLDLPQVQPYASKIKWAGYIGFGLPLLLYVGLLIPIFKSRKASLHGQARFANAVDLATHGLFKSSG